MDLRSDRRVRIMMTDTMPGMAALRGGCG